MTPAAEPSIPDQAGWAWLWEAFGSLLAPLTAAGWELSDDEDTNDSFAEFDREVGPVLVQVLRRTGMVLVAEWLPEQQMLELQPYDTSVDDEELDEYSMLDEPVTVRLDEPAVAGPEPLVATVGQLGLLAASQGG